MTAGDLLTHRIARHSGRWESAVVDEDGEVSYREFWARVQRTAASLADAAAAARRIAVLPTSDIGSLVVVVAAMYAGVSVVLLHRHLLPQELTEVLTVCRPLSIVAHPRGHARIHSWLTATCAGVKVCAPEDLATTPTGSLAPVTPSSELLVGVTSGTVGTPKMFVRNQASWAATLDRSDALFHLGPGDRVSAPGTLDHTHFLYGALHGLTRGATVDLRDPVVALKSHATHLYTVPTISWDIARSAARSSTVREVLSSAARWPGSGRAALAEVLPNAAMTHFYGASELSFVSFDRRESGGVEVLGALFRGVEVEIRDELLYVRSDMLFDGYLNRADGRERLTGGPVEGWMTVGDRGRYENDRLILRGRSSDTIIRAGLTVELAPIEAALLSLPGVLEAGVTGLPNSRTGEVPAAAVVVARHHSLTVTRIRRHLRAVLPVPSLPVVLVIVHSLPRTPRGKLDRQALAATLATVRTVPTSSPAPVTTNHTVNAPDS